MDVIVREEVVLPRRVVPQPQPFVVPGGDCGACVLAGILETSVTRVYEDIYRGRKEALSRPELENVLREIERKGLLDRLVIDVPLWPPSWRMSLAFGHAGHLSFPEWFAYVRMAMDAGYYGIASVIFDRSGVGTKVPPNTDHVVLICGARTVEVPLDHMPGVSRFDEEVLVSCSARSSPNEEWVEVRDFLATRGGYNLILVRPRSAPRGDG
jgi:hypothetical protein